jgi:hypothetical protein
LSQRRGPRRDVVRARRHDPPGSETGAKAQEDSPETWETRMSLARGWPGSSHSQKPQALLPASGSEERRQAQEQVPPSEATEVRRDGHSGFGAFHSTGEVGELAFRGSDGGKGRPSQ